MATQVKKPSKKAPTPPPVEEEVEETGEDTEEVGTPPVAPKPLKSVPNVKEDVHPSLAKYTEAELTKMRENVRALNERIKAFRNLGWELHLDGLHEPTPLVAKQTGTHATILIDGKYVFLNVGQIRTHNDLIKRLGGVWRAERSSWRLDSDKLPYIRGSFVIEDEKTTGKDVPSTPASATSIAVPKGVKSSLVQEREAILIPAGDAVVIRGFTRPIKDELKLVAPGMRWNGEEQYWTAKKQFYNAIVGKIEELIEDKRLDSYRIGDADEL